ncbi:MAG: phenylacetate--CoA ligase family protein, partial [Solirubrobacteraceae bacterium]
MSYNLGAEELVGVESPYWNPKTETLERDRLETLQLAKLRRQVSWAAERSPWYRRTLSGIDAESLRTIDDLRRLPTLTRDQWLNSQFEHPPYGELPTIDGAGAIRVHTTSGTSGRGPLRALDSRKDWAWIAEMWGYAIWGCGIRPADTAYIAFGYGSFIGFWGLHYAMEK